MTKRTITGPTKRYQLEYIDGKITDREEYKVFIKENETMLVLKRDQTEPKIPTYTVIVSDSTPDTVNRLKEDIEYFNITVNPIQKTLTIEINNYQKTYNLHQKELLIA